MKTFCNYFFSLLILWGSPIWAYGRSDSVVTSAQTKKPYPFALLAPKNNEKIVGGGGVSFVWENRGDPNPPNFKIKSYVLSFWSQKKGFGKTFTIFPKDTNKIVCFKLNDFRRIFKHQGKYYWKVTAYDVEGNYRSSEIRSFIVKFSNIRWNLVSESYAYGIRFQYTHRLRLPEYEKFLKRIYPTIPMRSFSDISLVFKQGRRLKFEERFLLLSQVGVGCGILSKLRLIRNLYFSLYPHTGVLFSSFSKGLENYTSISYSFHVGGDVVIMPRGYVTFKGSWIPVYNIRYAQINGELRTFQGKGWEVGVRLIIPHTILNTFRLLGMEFDFQRLPLEFYFSNIRDQYSGTLMKVRRVSVEYLL